MKCFSCGVITGVIVGILFAPKKGKETRQDLKEEFDKCQSRVQKLFGKGEEELNQLKELLEDEAGEISMDAREQLLQLVKETQRKYRFVCD